jgi:Fic family protein
MVDIGSPRQVEISSDTQELLHQIDVSIKTFEAMKPLDEETQQRIKMAFLPDRVTASLNMEGIKATRRQTLAILDSMTLSENTSKTEQEILNALRADELTFEYALSETALSERFVRELNALIEDGIGECPGTYRPRDVQISQASFNPPDHLSVPFYMKQLTEEYNLSKTVHTVVKAAWLHDRFTQIHPFLDGNGRTGRLLQDFCLLAEGLLPTGIPSSKRDDYYDALAEADKNNWDRLIQIISLRELEVIAKAHAIANERKQRSGWIKALAKKAGDKKAGSQHKNYLVWAHKMNEIRAVFEETARELNEISDVLFVRHQNFEIVDFSTWKEICERGYSQKTWFFSQQFFLEGECLFNYVCFFKKHRSQPADIFATQSALVSLFITGGETGQTYDFQRFSDPDIRLREVLFQHEDMYAYRSASRTSEESSPAVADSPSDLVREFYEDVFQRKLGV